MTTMKTLPEVLKETNPPVPEFTQTDICAAHAVNRRTQLMKGYRQAAALNLIGMMTQTGAFQNNL